MFRNRIPLLLLLVVSLAACTAYDRPLDISSDPLEHRTQLMEALESFDHGQEIYVVLRDGESYRARYRGHGDTELLVVTVRSSVKSLFTLGLSGQEHVQPLSNVEFVAQSRLSGPTKVLYASIFVLGVATFVSYALAPPDDP